MVPPLVKARLLKVSLPVAPLPTTSVAPLPIDTAARGAERVPLSVVAPAAVILVALVAPLRISEPALTPKMPVKPAIEDIVTLPVPFW